MQLIYVLGFVISILILIYAIKIYQKIGGTGFRLLGFGFGFFAFIRLLMTIDYFNESVYWMESLIALTVIDLILILGGMFCIHREIDKILSGGKDGKDSKCESNNN